MIRAELPKDNKRFWNRYAWLYDFEIDLVNRQAYQQMYKPIQSFLAVDINVLKHATGTGLRAGFTLVSVEAHRV